MVSTHGIPNILPPQSFPTVSGDLNESFPHCYPPNDFDKSSSTPGHESLLRIARLQFCIFNNFSHPSTTMLVDLRQQNPTHNFKRWNHSCQHALSLIAVLP
nr:hypothetical transcript [Hymenolepis microstoma]